MSYDNSTRMLARCMAQIRQRLKDDLVIEAMIESGDISIKVKNGALFRKDESDSFRKDLRDRIREAQELIERAGFSVSDEALVDAYEATSGQGADAKALWAEIRHRGLID